MDTASCTCKTVAWGLSHIAPATSLRSSQSTPASCETSIQQILVQLLISQLESLDVVLIRFLVVDLCSEHGLICHLFEFDFGDS
jgi:hypothetical protein